MTSFWTRAVREAGILGAYVVLTLAGTWPLLRHFGDALPGPTGDNWQFYWNIWWLERSLLERHTNPFLCPDVFRPGGAVLYFHTLNFIPSVLALPVASLFGRAVAYNLLAVAGFAVGGYAAYRLALQELGAQSPAKDLARRAAFLGGAAFTFSASHFMHLRGHLDMVQVYWLPLYALALQRVWRGEGRRAVVAAAVLLGAIALTSWYFLLGAVLLTAARLAHGAVVERVGWPAPRRLLLAGGLAALLVSPVLAPMLRLGSPVGRDPLAKQNTLELSADLGAYLVPSTLHPLWGAGVRPFYERLAANETEMVVFLGWTPLVLAVAGWRGRPRFWAAGLGLLALFSLGPVLHVAGRSMTPPILPYGLVQLLPYGDIPRNPSRLSIFVVLCLSVLASAGAARVLRASGRRGSAVFALLLAALLVENLAVPYVLSPIRVPAAYDVMAADPRPVAVFEVPVLSATGQRSVRSLYQTHHGKALFGGFLSRDRPTLLHDRLPGFRELTLLSDEWRDVVPDPGPDRAEVARSVLRAHEAGYVVLDKPALDPALLSRARAITESLLGSPPLAEDGEAAIYLVPPPTRPLLYLHLQEGWHSLEVNDAGELWRWMGTRGRLVAAVPQGGWWRLAAKGASRDRPQQVGLWVDGRESARLEFPTAHALRRSAPMDLTPGRHVLELTAERTVRAGPADGRQISIGVRQIAIEELRAMAPGQALDLGGPVEAYLGPGWSEPEGRHRWTDGRRAVVYLPLTGRVEAPVLQLEAEPFLPPGGRQRVVFGVNGRSVGGVELATPGNRVISVPLPVDIGGRYELVLDLPDASRRSDLGVGADAHLLALAVRRLRVVGAAASAPNASR